MFKFIFIVRRGPGDIFDITVRAKNKKAAVAKLRKVVGQGFDRKIREVEEIIRRSPRRRKR